MTTVLQILFFTSIGLIVFSQFGYPLVLLLIRSLRRPQEATGPAPQSISLVIAAAGLRRGDRGL